MKPVAIQLYTLRDLAAQDYVSVLQLVADAGYKGVETAGLYGCTPLEFAKIVADLGMVVCSTHSAIPSKENVAELAETQLALGARRLISGMGPDAYKTIDDIKNTAQIFNEGAALLKPYGLEFGFHNHWWEFDALPDGQLPYDVLLGMSEGFFSELDVYWAAFGGTDPAGVVNKHKSQIPLLHIKDGNLDPDKMHTAVGSGKLDMPGIIGAADPDINDWLIVELDDCATDMATAVKESAAYLKLAGLGLVN